MISVFKKFSNKAILLYLIAIITMIISGIALNTDVLKKEAVSSAILSAQQEFGSTPLAPEQEIFIRAIAEEIGVTQHLIIRKMNQKALAQFGYHNAIAFTPHMSSFIPIDSVSFLFISEGFFEDLSLEEQRFLIGHEMIHIKHGHLGYLPICSVLLFTALFICAWLMRSPVKLYLQRRLAQRYLAAGTMFVTYVLFCLCGVITLGAGLTYRRHIEKEADCESLRLLGSYEGCLQLTDRWQREFKVPLHNPYFGLTSDHPSCAERRAYCLALQNLNQKDLT